MWMKDSFSPNHKHDADEHFQLSSLGIFCLTDTRRPLLPSFQMRCIPLFHSLLISISFSSSHLPKPVTLHWMIFFCFIFITSFLGNISFFRCIIHFHPLLSSTSLLMIGKDSVRAPEDYSFSAALSYLFPHVSLRMIR